MTATFSEVARGLRRSSIEVLKDYITGVLRFPPKGSRGMEIDHIVRSLTMGEVDESELTDDYFYVAMSELIEEGLAVQLDGTFWKVPYGYDIHDPEDFDYITGINPPRQ